jgi:hypothetical protein
LAVEAPVSNEKRKRGPAEPVPENIGLPIPLLKERPAKPAEEGTDPGPAKLKRKSDMSPTLTVKAPVSNEKRKRDPAEPVIDVLPVPPGVTSNLIYSTAYRRTIHNLMSDEPEISVEARLEKARLAGRNAKSWFVNKGTAPPICAGVGCRKKKGTGGKTG